ncbi:SDR family oxidoreductase [bacterium]|nr:SDR family oxidoreductase [bacterium]
MNKLYVVGSSSKIAESIERLSGDNFYSVFFGRSNPLNLKHYIQYSGINNEDSVDELEDLIFNDLEQSDGLETVSLVILSGVSTNDWRESYLVNEYLPAKLSENFAKKVSDLDVENCSIVLISSSAAYQGAKLSYATTKASLTGVLRTIAKDYKNKVRINIILPSAFDSGMVADWDDIKRSVVAEGNFIGRLGTSDDMADAILFAIKNRFITNSIINMTGGTIRI